MKTRVTFRVDDAVYGTSSLVEVFDVLGGEAEGYGLAVEGMPKFAVGDREVVFAHRKASINPIVGFTQGVLRVRRDSGGVDRVFTLEGISLLRPESIGSPTSGLRMAAESSMTLSDFRSRIVMALADARKR